MERESKDDDSKKDKKGLNGRKKKGKKMAKNYQEDKINIMGKYFLKWNIFFCIKVILILLLSVSYYFVVSIIDTSTMTSMLSFDTTTNSIEGVYKSSFQIYLGLKTELAKYVDYEILKATYTTYLNSNVGNTVTYKGISYSNAQALIAAMGTYTMNIDDTQDTPKMRKLTYAVG